MSKMRKLAFTFLFMFTVSSLGVLGAPILGASEVNPENVTLVTEEQVEEQDKYITQDSSGYTLKADAYSKLSSDEIVLLEEQLKLTNNNFEVSEYSDTGKEYTNIVKDSELGKGARGAGVSKVVFYWWGVYIYLSKLFIRNLSPYVSQAGNLIAVYFGLSGWIGVALALGVMALGYGMKNIPHGVKIKYSFIRRSVVGIWQQ